MRQPGHVRHRFALTHSKNPAKVLGLAAYCLLRFFAVGRCAGLHTPAPIARDTALLHAQLIAIVLGIVSDPA